MKDTTNESRTGVGEPGTPGEAPRFGVVIQASAPARPSAVHSWTSSRVQAKRCRHSAHAVVSAPQRYAPWRRALRTRGESNNDISFNLANCMLTRTEDTWKIGDDASVCCQLFGFYWLLVLVSSNSKLFHLLRFSNSNPLCVFHVFYLLLYLLLRAYYIPFRLLTLACSDWSKRPRFSPRRS